MEAQGKLVVSIVIGAVVAASGGCLAEGDTVSDGSGAWQGAAADHHLHIRSQEAATAIGIINAKLGDMETEIIQEGMPPVTAQDAIIELDKAGIRQGVLLSVGYFFGMPEFDGENEYELVRSENNYTTAQAQLFPDRLIALCSVNPLREYALDEIGRCATELKSPGIKLNLSAVDVDFRNPDHVEKLRALFIAVHENDMGVAIHMRTRNPDFGSQDVEIFLSEVLSYTPGLALHVAHLAGWGGYDEQTDRALDTWISALDDGTIVNRSHVTFDIAAIIFEDNSEEQNRFAANRLRGIGLENITFGTDWSYLDSPSEYQALLFRKLQPAYSTLEIETIMANKARYFRD